MRTHLALWLAALSMVTLVGCASTGVGEPPLASDSLFADAAFKPPSAPVQPARALDISPEMVRFAEQQVRPSMRSKGLRDGLIDALYTKGQLRLDYDGADTRTASEAFAARRGNCLSLVLMTAAFARHFEMPVAFNSVVLDEWWTRDRGLFIVAGHVNITLARPVAPMGHMVWGDDTLFTIDFLPPQMLVRQRSRTVSEATVLAMYANNRAAELLAAGQLDDAYWWARAAVQSDPHWLAAHNTLAVIYHRKGLDGRAEDALRAVLAREPLNVQALSNIVVVLGAQGRPAEARRYAEQLAQIQPVPPYQYFDEGIVAMKAGDFATARALFRREIARAAYVPEFHFWLALASYGLGDWEAARAEMTRAMENSTTVKDHELYGAKLAWLNQQRRR